MIKSFGWWGEMNVLEAAMQGAQLPDLGTELRCETPWCVSAPGPWYEGHGFSTGRQDGLRSKVFEGYFKAFP